MTPQDSQQQKPLEGSRPSIGRGRRRSLVHRLPHDVNNQRLQAKAVRSLGTPDERVAILNNSKCHFEQIPAPTATCFSPDAIAAVEKLTTHVEVKVDDGLVMCHEHCEVDVQLLAAAGPVHVQQVQCMSIDGDADESLVGNMTLTSFGINVDHLL
ncbi:uncharacterized protein CCR75_005761 [Bremia lactucae]|uniref:Uncharacterized protein n=1 Tax=Bremia lactucae TaxID=4779 RepID=A0A976FG72_BRELC|nr:hypothetical protein CCR75_005761 [Bremia lactucae]